MLFKASPSANKTGIPRSVSQIRFWMKNRAVRLAVHLQKRFAGLSHRKKWFSFISFWLLFSSVSTWHIVSGLQKTKSHNITITSIGTPSILSNKSGRIDTFNTSSKKSTHQNSNNR